MSRAGTKSIQGDEYQKLIALHWLIKLIDNEDEIDFIEVESNGLPGKEEKITVDDIIIKYKDGQHLFIQAKKNQPRYQKWSIKDLKAELIKTQKQLILNEFYKVKFYSRTPFGNFHAIVEASISIN